VPDKYKATMRLDVGIPSSLREAEMVVWMKIVVLMLSMNYDWGWENLELHSGWPYIDTVLRVHSRNLAQ
jgi:hypothetical protein